MTGHAPGTDQPGYRHDRRRKQTGDSSKNQLAEQRRPPTARPRVSTVVLPGHYQRVNGGEPEGLGGDYGNEKAAEEMLK